MMTGHPIEIGGYRILFPCEPYPIQRDYMSKVIECLDKGQNGLLESPTGTGKTLSLLCSSLAWLKEYNRANPKMKSRIIYTARTHVQLHQACEEMRSSGYKDMRGLRLGGRDRLCLVDRVRKSGGCMKEACRSKAKNEGCTYYNNHRKKHFIEDFRKTPILDIEDLCSIGRTHSVCPYYETRILLQEADIIFAPYNYITDPAIRAAVKMPIANSVLIFDEGHNLEKALQDAATFELSSEELKKLILKLDGLHNQPECDPTQVKNVRRVASKLLGRLNRLVAALKVNQKIGTKGIFKAFDQINFTLLGSKNRMKDLSDIYDYCARNYDPNDAQKASQWATCYGHIDHLRRFYQAIFPSEIDDSVSWDMYRKDFIDKCRVTLDLPVLASPGKENEPPVRSRRKRKQRKTKKEQEEKFKGGPPKWVMHFSCLSPSVGMKLLQIGGPRSVIVTSGTLSPLESYAPEMEISFPVELINNHVIQPHQIGLYTLQSSPDDLSFNSYFKVRDDPAYIRAMGETICRFCQLIPGGVFVFFSSYVVMNNMHDVWQQDYEGSNVYKTLCQTKKIFTEPNDSIKVASLLSKFKKEVDQGNRGGAVFLAVCRGRLSEGLDLSDQYVRGVIMVGLPFLGIEAPDVKAKRAWLDSRKTQKNKYKGSTWYLNQMARAMNQAIGRVIRHRDDWGVILLLDARYRSYMYLLPEWLRPKDIEAKVKEGFDTISQSIVDLVQTNTQRKNRPHITIETTD